MKLLSRLAIAGALLTLAAAPEASAQSSMSDAERSRIESVVRDYLLRNPEVIMEVITELQRRSEAENAARQGQVLGELREELERDPSSPVLGNPEGDVVVVEFFDYQCGYCKQAMEPLRQLVEEDGNIRLVMKEFPILGEASILGARAALAAERQERYEEMHWALMGSRGELTEERVFELAEDAGLDPDRLREDMRDPAIEETLRRNHELAQQLDIRGTPAFVIGDSLMPGAVPLEQLQRAVEQARAES